MTAPVTIATALCDHRDFERHLPTVPVNHLAAKMHQEETGHRVMVIETTVTTYEPAPAPAVTA